MLVTELDEKGGGTENDEDDGDSVKKGISII